MSVERLLRTQEVVCSRRTDGSNFDAAKVHLGERSLGMGEATGSTPVGGSITSGA